MALKDYQTSELQAEITRRAHRCPICATLQVQLDEVAGALGASRMDGSGGYHYEAVSQLVRERDHYAKACVAAMRGQDPPWLDELTAALGWQGGTAVEAIHAVKRLVRAAKEQADLRKAEAANE